MSRPQPWQDTMRSLAVADTSLDAARDEGHAARQARPEGDEHLMQTPVRGRQCRIDDERARRGVVEQQHDVREQPVATAEVDDTAAAAHPPHAPRHLPRFVQLLARQALGRTDRPGDSIEQRLAAEAAEVVRGEPAVRAARERRSRMSHGAGVILPCPAGPGEARWRRLTLSPNEDIGSLIESPRVLARSLVWMSQCDAAWFLFASRSPTC